VRPAKYRDELNSGPDQAADPVLQEAFSRPVGGADSLQRHPVDAGGSGCREKRGRADEPDDPWRDPAAAAALGLPAVAPPEPPTVPGYSGKLGVRDVLFGGKVSYLALAVLVSSRCSSAPLRVIAARRPKSSRRSPPRR